MSSKAFSSLLFFSIADVRKVTIVCDSIPKHVAGIDGCTLQCFPGDTTCISKLTNRLISRDGCAPEANLEDFDFVIFHVGTNDIDNRASYNAILWDFGNMIAICRKQKPGIKIIISAIIPR